MNTALLDAIPQRPPGKWPFPPPSPSRGRDGAAGRSRDDTRGLGQHVPAGPATRPQGQEASLSLGRVVADVAMVLAWGAMIPGLMWLGHVAGF